MKILFVCRANVGRSQMAQALFNKMSRKNSAKSAGTNPGKRRGLKISQCKADNVIASMKALGMDISQNRTKQINRRSFESAQKVFVLTERENLPDYARRSRKVVMWRIPDPRNKSYRYHVRIRNMIKAKVAALVKKIG